MESWFAVEVINGEHQAVVGKLAAQLRDSCGAEAVEQWKVTTKPSVLDVP
jgi:hypothetical protein